MSYILPNFSKAIVFELLNSISTNSSFYYAFASNPIPNSNGVPADSLDDYSSIYSNNWKMLFGKLLTNNNILPVINNNTWTSNTVYDRYDNTVKEPLNDYVVVTPSVVGGDYWIFKCIDNANGSPSTVKPDQIQETTFYKSDGYAWRYITSISSANYTNFATSKYIPVYPNTTIQTNAANNAGVEVVMISNGGIGYSCYNNGVINSCNTSILQISSNASTVSNYYTNNTIYIYTNTSPTSSQLFQITNYVSNTAGNWVFVNGVINTVSITPSVTNYYISPSVIFDTDGTIPPLAYSVVNTVTNSISNIVMLNTGVNMSRANVSIVSNSNFGTGANLYAIVPPAGGHGSNPYNELNMLGVSISFKFSNTESNTILANNIIYNKIGILRNPYVLNTDGSKGSNQYTSNTFNQVIQANTGSITFTQYDTVVGQTSGAKGIVAYSNSTTLYLIGDQYFQNSEVIVSKSNSFNFATLNINKYGSIYTKDHVPLYTQNISDVTRNTNQNEAFKIIIQI
jgi:hypothetical protein